GALRRLWAMASRSFAVWLHDAAQCSPRVKHARFDRIFRAAQYLADFRIPQAEVIRQLDHRSLFRRDAFKRLVEITTDTLRFRMVALRQIPVLQHFCGSHSAEYSGAPAVGDAEYPGRQTRVAAKLRCLVPDYEEHVIDDFDDEIGITGNA